MSGRRLGMNIEAAIPDRTRTIVFTNAALDSAEVEDRREDDD